MSYSSALFLAQAGRAEPARLSSAHHFGPHGQLGSAQLIKLKLASSAHFTSHKMSQKKQLIWLISTTTKSGFQMKS